MALVAFLGFVAIWTIRLDQLFLENAGLGLRRNVGRTHKNKNAAGFGRGVSVSIFQLGFGFF